MSNRNNPHRGPRAIRLRPRPNANLRPESYYTKKIAAREKAAEVVGQSYPVHFNLLDNVTNDVRISQFCEILRGNSHHIVDLASS